MSQSDIPKSSANSLIDTSILEGSKVHTNVTQDFIVVTADRMKLRLRDHEAGIRTRLDWAVALSLSVAFLATLVVTNEFKDFFGISKSVWQAIFVICFISSSLWFIVSLVRLLLGGVRKFGNVDYIVESLIKESKTKTF